MNKAGPARFGFSRVAVGGPLQSVVNLPESEGGALIVGYVCNAIGQKMSRIAADDNETMQRALRDVNFDTMPHGWFIVVRKAPRP